MSEDKKSSFSTLGIPGTRISQCCSSQWSPLTTQWVKGKKPHQLSVPKAPKHESTAPNHATVRTHADAGSLQQLVLVGLGWPVSWCGHVRVGQSGKIKKSLSFHLSHHSHLYGEDKHSAAWSTHSRSICYESFCNDSGRSWHRSLGHI